MLEQYKVYVESIEKISDRRMSANNFILTLHTILISILSFIFQSSSFENSTIIKFVIPIIWIVLSVISWIVIYSYKQLNTGKFKVLYKIEEKLPLSLYKYEWNILWKWKNYKIYFPFSKIEIYIPFILWAIYILFIFVLIFQTTNNATDCESLRSMRCNFMTISRK